MKFKKFTLLFVFVLSAVMLKAQDPKEFKTWNLNIEGGLTKAYTDIRQYNFNPSFGDRSDLSYVFGLGLKKSLTPVFGIQAKFNVGQIKGHLTNDMNENLNRLTSYGLNGSHYHDTNIYSGSLNLVVNFSNIGFFTRNVTKPRKFLFYGLAGYGVLGYDAELRNYDDVLVDPATNPNVSQDNEDIEAVINGGLGIKYRLNDKFDIGLEINYNVTTTDFIDAIAVPGTSVDRFTTSMLTLNYKLPSKSNGATEHLDWASPGSDLIQKVDDLEADLDSLGGVVTEHINNQDTDGDGVPDANDKEPYSLFGSEVDANGVAKDTDGDGVPDGLDKEPDTPKGELVNYQGIAIGSQLKGTDPEMTEQKVKEIVERYNQAYFPSVFFASNSASVRSAAMSNLVAVATAMQKNSSLKIALTGHADKRGSEAYNNKLATRRAEAVKTYLVRNLGVDASRITVNAKGESEPKSSTLYSINRRVDIEGSN
ncbi:MAG: OmpA family protein [Flammeovirgaceae bacterium]